MKDLTRKQYVDKIVYLLGQYSDCKKTVEQIKISAHKMDEESLSNKDKFSIINGVAVSQKKKFEKIVLGIVTTKLPQSDSDKRNGVYHIETRQNGILISTKKQYSSIYISN